MKDFAFERLKNGGVNYIKMTLPHWYCPQCHNKFMTYSGASVVGKVANGIYQEAVVTKAQDNFIVEVTINEKTDRPKD